MTVAEMKIGLGVLSAVRDGLLPSSSDVEMLRRLVPAYAHMAADEVACEVVRIAIEERAAVQDAGGD